MTPGVARRPASAAGTTMPASAALAGHGLLLWLWLAGVPPKVLLLAWLGAALFFLGLASGAQAIVCLQRLTGGRWLETLMPPVGRLARAAPFAALPLLVLSFVLPVLFPWAGEVPAHAAALVGERQPWLSPGFLIARTVAFVAVAALLASRRASAGAGRAAGGLVLWLLSVSWLAADWIMSLDAAWYSTAIGLWLAASFGLSALAASAALAMLGRPGPDAERRNDVACLLLAAVLFWFYISYMQYLVVWSGNLPEEIGWFVTRRTALWAPVSAAMVAFIFVVPLGALIFGPVRRSPLLLAGVALSVLLGRVLESAWQVQPAAEAAPLGQAVAALGALTGLGGLFALAILPLGRPAARETRPAGAPADGPGRQR